MRRFSAALAGILLLGEFTGAQVTSSVRPVADAFVASASPDTNYGGAGALSIAAPGLPKGEFRSFMRFDTSSIKSAFDTAYGPGQWTVQSASLRLTSGPPMNPIFNGHVPEGTHVNTPGSFQIAWIPDDTWIEGDGSPMSPNSVPGAATFNAPPNASGAQSLGVRAFPGGISGNNTYALDLSAGMLSDLNSGSVMSLSFGAADNSIAYTFFALDFGTAGSRPLLSITAIPEPAATLLATGIGMLLMLRTRARHEQASD